MYHFCILEVGYITQCSHQYTVKEREYISHRLLPMLMIDWFQAQLGAIQLRQPHNETS